MQNFPYLLTLNEVRVLDHFLLIFIIKGADFVHVIRNNGYFFIFKEDAMVDCMAAHVDGRK